MKTSAVAVAAIAITLSTFPADTQVQERTIRWGHLNNTDHPVSLGVQKFAVLAAKSGGKLKVASFRRRNSATRCRCNRRCAAARRT
jgi:TRAP-type transport system periplasmic protein